MVESVGVCEKHELPLDHNGECELCRLSDMPSKAPPARSAWWAVVVPLLVLLAGALWMYGSLGSDPERAVPQGVQPITPEPEAVNDSPAEEPARVEPERVPPRSTPPSPEEIPTPADYAP